MKYNPSDLINADTITSRTLLGIDCSEFPIERGNCFSVKSGNEEYRIVNFNYENLLFLISSNKVWFPIKILPLSKNVAVICDGRFPKDFYQTRFCETCTPEDLLPVAQRINQLMDMEKGIRTEKMTDMGKIIGYNVESKIIKTDWMTEEGKPIFI